jgi:type IV pilus assembly protein PilB
MDSTDLTRDGAEAAAADHAAETADARRLAERYRLEFVDMDHFRIDGDLFRSIPAELMLRYGFVPWRREGKALVVVVSDPRDQPMFDELSALLSTPLKVAVGARSAIQSMLKKSESSQRVLEDATEGFEIQLLKEDDGGEDSLTVERLTSDISPIIRLVDSVIFSALQRRASDIHIETQDDAVHVKYRIDGVLQPAMRSLQKQFHSSIISRIKVMAELDIAEKRVPQASRARPSTFASRSCQASTERTRSSASSTRSRSASSSPSCASTSWGSPSSSCAGSGSTSPSPTAWCL